MVKVCVKSFQEFFCFNSLLSLDGIYLIFKKYINVGIVVDMFNGLVVLVIKDVDKKLVKEIVLDMQILSEKVCFKKLLFGDMQGGIFLILLLGGIGGMAFMLIVNWLEVLILGVLCLQMKLVYNGEEFELCLMVLLFFFYDYWVVDGVDVVCFIIFLL